MTGDEMAERGTDRWMKAHRMEVLRQVVTLLESINTDDEVQGSINFLLYGDTRGFIHEPLDRGRQKEHELRAQLEEALAIIKELVAVRDIYNSGYCILAERIAVLRLKQ
jgi:hypothetical protein